MRSKNTPRTAKYTGTQQHHADLSSDTGVGLANSEKSDM